MSPAPSHPFGFVWDVLGRSDSNAFSVEPRESNVPTKQALADQKKSPSHKFGFGGRTMSKNVYAGDSSDSDVAVMAAPITWTRMAFGMV